MEENKNKKNNLSIIFLILALIVIVAMAVYIYIEKGNTKEEISTLETNASSMQSTIDELQGKIDSISNTIGADEKSSTDATESEAKEVETNKEKANFSVLELSPIGGIAVLYQGEVYVNVYDSTPNIDGVYGDGKYQTLVKNRDSYQEYSFDSLTVNNNTTKWAKLNISNVKAIYNNEYGQDLFTANPKYGIIMLNEDNTVSYISIEDLIDGKTGTEKLDVSNIYNVENVNDNGYTTYLIDANGNKNNVNNYIK